ncbi:MAG: IS630 family transposase, partial [Pyrinomonadaceae bacterium]
PDMKRRKIWFMDETGVNLALSRTFGRAFGGQRANGNVPKNYGVSVTVLGAMRCDGRLATLEVRGATDELVMLAFIREILSPVLEPGDVVVMDNLTSHKTRRVQAAFTELGVEVWYLPPYSPDLNPIEMCWSKFKASLKQTAARTYDTLSEAISNALEQITPADAESWTRHCGYV